AAMAAAGATAPRLFLVGGASRMPLVATLLHRELGVTPTIAAQPELAVAIGAVSDTDATTPDADPVVAPAADGDRMEVLTRTATALAALLDKRTTELRRKRAATWPQQPPRPRPRNRTPPPRRKRWPSVTLVTVVLSALVWLIIQTTDTEPAFAAQVGDCVS